MNSVAGALAAVWVLVVCGCGASRSVPALPNVDASKFQPDVGKAVESALAEAKKYPNDASRTLRLCMVLHAYEQYQAAGQCYARAHALAPPARPTDRRRLRTARGRPPKVGISPDLDLKPAVAQIVKEGGRRAGRTDAGRRHLQGAGGCAAEGRRGSGQSAAEAGGGGEELPQGPVREMKNDFSLACGGGYG